MATATRAPAPRKPDAAAVETRAPEAVGNGAIDTTVRLTTPERIVFEYPLAGPFRRAYAYALDQLFIWAVMAVVSIAMVILSVGGFSSLGPILVAYFVMSWGYQAFCESMFNGRTLGKRAAGLRVLADNGVAINASQAVVRNVVGAADGLLPFFYLPGLTSMLLTSRFQRLGDLAAGTIVVVEENRRRAGVTRIDEKPALDLLPWLPMRIAAGSELSRALSDYVRARSKFGPARREEMAEHLAGPLRARFSLPPRASADAVLCAVYHRVFLGE